MEFAASLWNAGYFALSYLLPFLFVLTLVVFVHELGHFLVGRWCGVDVQTFSIGFRVGLALVLMLMLFVTWNDIVHVRGML